MNLLKTIKLPNFGDDRGGLIAIEAFKSIPFDIKRVYFIYGSKAGISRGFHAHKQLKQLLVCVSGSCKIRLSNGETFQEITLASPSLGLIVEDMTWREMHEFSDDCVLLVLADQLYDEDDYIREFDQFLKEVKK